MVRILTAAALTAAALTAAASAGWSNNEPLALYVSEREINQPVAHLTWCRDCVGVDWTTSEPWAVNPGTNWPYDLPAVPGLGVQTGCVWDADDEFVYRSRGNTLAAGASVTVDECVYERNSFGPILVLDITVTSPSPDLLVTAAWTWEGGSAAATVPPVADGQGWRYFACLQMPAAVGAVAVEIPGSHGGVARPQRLRVTVANTGRKVGRTGALVSSGVLPGAFHGCTVWELV
jgi:hypothetical protein